MPIRSSQYSEFLTSFEKIKADHTTRYAALKKIPVIYMMRDVICDIEGIIVRQPNYTYQIDDNYRLLSMLSDMLEETNIETFKKRIGPNKFYLLLKHFGEHIHDRDFWKVLGEQYIMCNPRLGIIHEDYYELFRSKRPFRRYLMTATERKFLKGLPNVITIHRGMSCDECSTEDYRYSWTMNKERAKFFANDFYSRKGKVASLKVSKDSIIAFFNERNEEEVIYFHSWL